MADNNLQEKIRCDGCDGILRKIRGQKKLINSEDEVKEYSSCLGRKLIVNSILCSKCRIIIYRKRESVENTDSADEAVRLLESTSQDPTFKVTLKLNNPNNESENELIDIDMQRTVATHKYCCLCSSVKNLTVIPEEARMQCYIKKKIFIPVGNRCCITHLIRNRIYEEDLNLLKAYSNTSSLSASELTKVMKTLTIKCDSTLYDKIGEFSISEQQIKVFTGLSWENLLELKDMMTSMRNTQSRSIIQALVVFFFKLRTGNSNKVLASILNIENEQIISDYSSSVIKSFEKDILPGRFGIMSMDRDDLIKNHTTDIAKRLFNVEDKLFLICDGTYARHQKSTNNEYQRKSYSGQKKVPLCKPFTICTTDGFVVDMLGPYPATQNDAEIMKIIIDDPNGLCTFLKPGDIFILDRGFRDVQNHLEEKDFEVMMPALKGKRKQLTTEESNQSRFVTKNRWVVEAVHGVIKQKYRSLDHKIDNKLLPKVGIFFKIAAFINNKFGKRLTSDVELAEDILAMMHSKKNVSNKLAIEAEEKGWFRRKTLFKPITSDEVPDFPEMTERQLITFFTGSYQLSQAVSYLAEMVDDDGKLNMEYAREEPNVLKVKVQSRHISRTSYRCFIRYAPGTIGVSGIKDHACECANGRRTVGCCSHIAAIVYYLSHARYLSRIPKPAKILSDIFLKTQITAVINEDSNED